MEANETAQHRNLPSFAHEVRGEGDAPWLTFVPGIGNDREFWAPQADAISRYRKLLFDPWGHGASPAPPTECKFEDVVEGLVRLLDRLEIPRTSVVGLGFGGSVALATAASHSDRVERVVACCCRPRQPDDRRQFWRDRHAKAEQVGMAAMADITVERWLNAEFRAAHSEVDTLLREMFRRTTLAGYAAYTGAFAEMDFTERLSAVVAPTLLLAGELDKGGGPPEDMRQTAGAIPGARFEVVRGAGHIINYEAPDTVRQLIEEFL